MFRTFRKSPFTSHYRKSICLACLLLLSPFFHTVYAGNGKGNGKPGGGDDPPITLPPVRFQLTMLDDYFAASLNTRASGVNASGTVIGYLWGDSTSYRSAFLYTSTMGVVELSALAGAVWTDLAADPSAGPATGWIAEDAIKINAHNEISGRAIHSETAATRPYILINTFSAPQFLLLPKVGNGDVSYVHLNDHADVIATQSDPELGMTTVLYENQGTPTSYKAEDLRLPSSSAADINNSGVIVTYRGYRYDRGLPEGSRTTYFPGYKFYSVNNGINGLAMMTGGRDGKKGKNGFDGGAILMDIDGDQEELLFASQGPVTLGRYVNDSNHVCFHGNVDGGQKAFLYTSDYGAAPLGELMDVGSQQGWLTEPGDQVTVGISNEALGTGYGYICGRFQDGTQNRAFLLTPIIYQDE